MKTLLFLMWTDNEQRETALTPRLFVHVGPAGITSAVSAVCPCQSCRNHLDKQY